MVNNETGSRIPIWRILVFFKTEVDLSCGLSYPIEMWFAERLWPSQESDVTQSNTRSNITLLWLLS